MAYLSHFLVQGAGIIKHFLQKIIKSEKIGVKNENLAKIYA